MSGAPSPVDAKQLKELHLLTAEMRKIALPEEGIETLYGAHDANLKHIESLLNVDIRTQGDELTVRGRPGRRTARAADLRPAADADGRGVHARQRRREDRGAAAGRRTPTSISATTS